MKKSLIFIFLAIALWCLFVGGCILYFVYNNPYTIELNVSGQSNTTIEWGTPFAGFEATACGNRRYFNYHPLELPVETSGSVDTNTLGSYELTYTAIWEDQTITEVRTVQVVDTQMPEITLIGEAEYSILPGVVFEDPGATATDNHDGDLTGNIEISQNGEQLIYRVTDASGNQAQVIRTVTVHDPVAPEITLLGDAEITISAGGYYRDAGCTAQDNCDGDLTDKVTVTGSVDTFVPGTYKLTYQVIDSYDNLTQAVRTVQVLPIEGLTVGAPNGKNIYLTFDDGPGPYTQQLLDVLDQYDIKVTFFVVANGYTETLARIAQDGHSIGMHAGNHSYKQIYRNEEAYLKDFSAIQEHIQLYTGLNPVLMRFPGGSSNTVSKKYNKGIMTRLTHQMTEEGYIYFDWNVDSDDAGGTNTAEKVFENVSAGVQKQDDSVVLQHDVRPYSVEAVEQIIRWGLENGYRFLPLTETSPTCHHPINN